VDGMASIAEETASASEESASSTEELTASMEEMTARAQELSELAMNLQRSSTRFTLEQEGIAHLDPSAETQPAVTTKRVKKVSRYSTPAPDNMFDSLSKRGISI